MLIGMYVCVLRAHPQTSTTHILIQSATKRQKVITNIFGTFVSVLQKPITKLAFKYSLTIKLVIVADLFENLIDEGT